MLSIYEDDTNLAWGNYNIIYINSYWFKIYTSALAELQYTFEKTKVFWKKFLVSRGCRGYT